MGYHGGNVASLFGQRAQAATSEAVRKMAHRGGERMLELTVMNTPIGGRVGEGHGGGNLRSSWYQLDVRPATRDGDPGWETGVASDVDYAPDVEYGTGLWGPLHRKYLIEPKTPGGVLRWFDPHSGQEVFARRVWHPGSPGQHMLGTAANVVESEMQGGLFQSILTEWADAVERAAD